MKISFPTLFTTAVTIIGSLLPAFAAVDTSRFSLCEQCDLAKGVKCGLGTATLVKGLKQSSAPVANGQPVNVLSYNLHKPAADGDEDLDIKFTAAPAVIKIDSFFEAPLLISVLYNSSRRNPPAVPSQQTRYVYMASSSSCQALLPNRHIPSDVQTVEIFQPMEKAARQLTK